MSYENPAGVNRLLPWLSIGTRLMLPLMRDPTMVKKMETRIAAWDKGKDQILRGAPHLNSCPFPGGFCPLSKPTA